MKNIEKTKEYKKWKILQNQRILPMKNNVVKYTSDHLLWLLLQNWLVRAFVTDFTSYWKRNVISFFIAKS